MVFLVSYWTSIRSSSTETESSVYAKSQSSNDTVVSNQSNDNPIQQLEDPLRNLELSIELKSKIRKLEFELKKYEKKMRNQELNHQSVINQLTREKETANNDGDELENELISAKSYIDQLEFKNQRLENRIKQLETAEGNLI